MPAYYNEHDAFAAAWLRNLIAGGHIAAGDVDERSIVDVRADDLRGYAQCHFFAGIGGWSLALRLAGWPDDRPVWTGSCPCQPLSSAGKQQGHVDERHLWPAFFGLIAECRPATIFGEQVASALGREWLAGVRADLEASRYAVGAADLCAAGVGAPHIRQRIYWVADSNVEGRSQFAQRDRGTARGSEVQQRIDANRRGDVRGLADTLHAERRPEHRPIEDVEHWQDTGRAETRGNSGTCGPVRRLGDAEGPGLSIGERNTRDAREVVGAPARQGSEQAGAAHFWSDFYVIPCSDGKTRRSGSGVQPLAHGVPGRVGRLRGYGNAIVPQLAAEFIRAADDVMTKGSI